MDAPLTPAPLRQLPVTLRPDPKLLKYYFFTALLAGPAFPVAMLVLYFRYHTLRYDVDAEGLTMRWGILFRREVSLTYARLQDIHLTSNVVERYLGLAKVQLQTASSSAQAEMNIEGLTFFEPMRDFLYARMRGAREEHGPHAPPGAPALPAAVQEAPLAQVLREVAAEVRSLRAELAEVRRRGDA
ncbi:PH domain-containing protein [Aggregicoccus sp. 17bor-14]|uniref:PH domain-containing protein n=1 Tax=Myxococcaceae TaxID=31 RepID=UPI00129D1E5C|nr:MULTISPECIES: PH domain-containing protein [Myxococcaceae]MBF5046031.1 PH domain-containing protein [Simulacricoccus sp. 17bor-14]MRI91762.1 PH domain-containing protein [Aggregicoccus sp. 17bor-14]